MATKAWSEWQGLHVVVTGASRGIGVSIVEEASRRGAKVTMIARSESALAEIAARIGGVAFPLDLADLGGLVGVIDQIEATAGPIDVLINNAAVVEVGDLPQLSAAHVVQAFAVNAVAPAELIRQVMPRMLARGRGSIACVSSLAGLAAIRGTTLYGATKAALMQLCTGVQRELRGTTVRLTLMVLGEVAGTDMMEQSRAHPAIKQFSQRMARLRVLPMITPEQVAIALLDGIEHERDLVVMPRWAAVLCWAREFPTRVNDLLARGIY